jgi:hypothetical protein
VTLADDSHPRGRGAASVVPRVHSWSPEALCAVGLLALYVAVLKGHMESIDGLVMFRQGTSWVLHGSMRLEPGVVWGQQLTASKYGVGQSLVETPFIALAHLLGVAPAARSATGTLRQYYADPLWTVGCSWISCAVTALTAYAVGRCLRALGSTKTQILVGVLGYGLASPALTYSNSSYAQPLAGLAVAVAAVAFVRWATDESSGLLLLAAAIAACVITRPVEGVVLGVGSVVFVAVRRPRQAAWIWPLAGLASGLTIDLVVNQLRFGSPLETGYSETWRLSLDGVIGLSVNPGRGIVWFMPLCLLAPLGLVRLTRGGRGLEAWWLASVVAALFATSAFWDAWWGGHAWGPRLLVPALPLLAVLSASAVRTRSTTVLAAAAIVTGALLALPTVVVDLLAVRSASSSAVFRLHDLPMVSAWKSLKRVVPQAATDRSGIDVIWARLAKGFGHEVLLVPVLLVAVALASFALALRSRAPVPPGQPGAITGGSSTPEHRPVRRVTSSS